MEKPEILIRYEKPIIYNIFFVSFRILIGIKNIKKDFKDLFNTFIPLKTAFYL